MHLFILVLIMKWITSGTLLSELLYSAQCYTEYN